MILKHISRGIYEAKQTWNFIIRHIEPKMLVASSHLFLIPNIISIVHPPPGPVLIMPILLVVFVFSIAFWSDPVRFSHVHRMDAIVAKIAIITFILYVFTYTTKPKLLAISLSIMLMFFYMSSVYSAQVWCGPEHLLMHCCAHIMGVICICFVWL